MDPFDRPNPFKYIKPSDDGIARIQQIRGACAMLFDALNEYVPTGREKSLAITKLEEVSMWANKGISFAFPAEEGESNAGE